jgi:hypothetical protein
MVITKEVPRSSWRRVLDDLSRLHLDATARLMVLDAEHGVQSHGDAFRLVGLTSDGDAGSESIVAILALPGGAHVTHSITGPRRLHLELLWETRTANVQIADANGTRTLICLGAPVLGTAAAAAPAASPRRAADAIVARPTAALVKRPDTHSAASAGEFFGGS